MRGMRRDKTRKDLNEKVTLELPALSITASSWVEKDMHGDVVEEKMGSWDESVMMVSLNQKKVSRDLPTDGVRIIKIQERATVSLARSMMASRAPGEVIRWATTGLLWRTRSEEELILMEVITVAMLRKGKMLDLKILSNYSFSDLL